MPPRRLPRILSNGKEGNYIMKKILALILLTAMLATSFTACVPEDANETTAADTTASATDAPANDATDAPTEESTEAPSDEATEAPTDEATEETTEEPTAAPTEETTEEIPEVKNEITDGMMLYYEDFSKYGDVSDLDATMAALGWKIQTKADDYAYSDWTSRLSIANGQLVVNNYDAATDFKGNDSYALMLDEDYMKDIAKYGDYTLQYEVTYTDASNYKRYICLLTDYYGDTYNSYHFRIGGYANNQGHVYGEWVTYDVVDPTLDMSAKLTACDPQKGTTIAYKLLGIDTEIKDAAAIENFRNVTVTIRIQHDNDLGNIIYMKTSEMADFVCVSMPREDAPGAADWYNVVGAPGLAFKVGGAINGTVDNIAMWAGLGDMPEDTTVTYVPAE